MKSKNILLEIFAFLIVMCGIFGLTACGGDDNTPAALSAPQIELTDNVISWTAVENADIYEVYENNTRVAQQPETSYTISQTAAGTFKYKVKAISADGNHSSSKFSNEVTYTVNSKTQLATPQLSLDKATKTVSWTAVDNADGYNVYENGELISSQTETSYTIAHTETGMYKYAVKATSANENYSESRLSDEVSYIITEQLATPQITIDEATKTISWEPVEHADSYAIYENGYVLYSSWTETSYEIEQTIVGTYTYSIRARSNNGTVYLNSNESNKVSVTIEPTALATPDGLAVDGNILSWNTVDDGSDEYNVSYNVYENDLLVSKRQPDNFYVIPLDHEAGEFNFTVKAIPAVRDTQHLESNISAPYSHTIIDDRTPLATPSGLDFVTREEYKHPVDEFGNRPNEEKVTRTYLIWNAVDNATGYFVYDNGKRICTVGGSEYVVSDSTPGTHKFQVKAMTERAHYKPSELSEEKEYTIEVDSNTEFTIRLDTTNATGFNSSVNVALFSQGGDGLPLFQIQGTEKTVMFGITSVVIKYKNDGKYLAKITNLPNGYVASVAKLSASATEGTITIYKIGVYPSVELGKATTVYASGGQQGTAGTEQIFLFAPTAKGQYSLNTDSGMICTVNGNERYMFTADAGEAVLITVNCQNSGSYQFSVSAISKRYINFGEMDSGSLSGPSNVIYDDTEITTFYMHASAEPKRYTIMFTTATMANTRFVTLTINGVDYEFDGGYCTTLNITIPASSSDIVITARMTGSAPEDSRANVHFYVIPLTED